MSASDSSSPKAAMSPSAIASPLTEEAFQRASYLKQSKSIPSDEESAEIAKQLDIKRRFLIYVQSLRSPPILSPETSQNKEEDLPEVPPSNEESFPLATIGQGDDEITQEEQEDFSLLGFRRQSTQSTLEPQIRKQTPKIGAKKNKRKGKKAPRKTYCLCKQPDGNEFMVKCDGHCHNWYHPVCLGLKESIVMMECENNPEKKFFCWDCQETEENGSQD